MTAHRQHGHRPGQRAKPESKSENKPEKRSSTGAPTGAIVRPVRANRDLSAEDRRRASRPVRTSQGVTSLGEARAHRRLRRRDADGSGMSTAGKQRAPRDRPARARRRVKTTKPLLVTRFGAGRPRFRLISTLVALLLVLVGVLAKVGLMQGQQGEALRNSASELWTRTRSLPAQRGAIFDRNGDELALSVPAATVAVNPQQVNDPAGTARVLAQLIDLSDERRDELQTEIETSTAGFLYVARQIEPAIAEQIDELGLLGVSTYSEDRRIMPGGQTGRSVIGRTDIDGVGTAGLELQFDDLLEGVPGEMTLEVAPGGRTIAGTEHLITPAVAGVDIITTIDRSVQHATEQALLRQVNVTGAVGGQVIVQDTDTGDIMAMATVTRNDAGAAVVSSGNYSAVGAYEPGSVGKVITLAGALEDGQVSPDTGYVVPWQHDCTDNPADGILSDSHQHDPEAMSVRDILVESSNVGTIYVAKEIGYERLYHYITGFGLGEVSGLGFPGESPGILRPWQQWEGTERCTVAYGQGLASSPVQLVTAVNVIANDGVYVAPRLVMGTVGADGQITDVAPSASRYVVSPETAAQMQSIMRDTVCDANGTAADASVDGLSVAGKTGTAYKAQPDGTYWNEDGKHDYYSSFVGFFPAEDPQITLLISIDEPQEGFNSGAQSAAPLFRALVPTIVHELAVQSPPGSTDCDGV